MINQLHDKIQNTMQNEVSALIRLDKLISICPSITKKINVRTSGDFFRGAAWLGEGADSI